MALTPFNTNLDIIAALADEPNDVGGLGAAQLKAKFDEAGNLIKDYINLTLIPEITSDITAAAEGIGAGGTLDTEKISDAAITEPKLAPVSVTRGKVAPDAIGTNEVENGSITLPKLNKNATALSFKNVMVDVASWSSNASHEEYPYRAAVPLTGVTSKHFAEVIFNNTDRASGNFHVFADTYDGGVYIYCRNIPAGTKTISNIVCIPTTE